MSKNRETFSTEYIKNLNHTLTTQQKETFWALVNNRQATKAIPFLFTAYIGYTYEEIITVFENYLSIPRDRAERGAAKFIRLFEPRGNDVFVWNPKRYN